MSQNTVTIVYILYTTGSNFVTGRKVSKYTGILFIDFTATT
jgi:hypothetical protein